MTRPPVPDYPVPPRTHWVAVIDDTLDWLVLDPDDPRRRERVCRFTTGRSRCQSRPDAVLYRGRARQPYLYCAEHLYGRWIEDGHVMAWHLVPA